MADDLGSLIAKLGVDVTDLKQGLMEGRQQLASFQGVAESFGQRIKEVLSFAGISLGLYEIVSQLKQFASSILEIGGKSELLRISAEALGRYYHLAAGDIDLYVQKLQAKGIEEDRALQAVNNFLKAGVSIDFLPKLAQAAQDLAPSMAMTVNDAFDAIVKTITKGTPKALAELTPGIREALAAASSETKKMLDSTLISGAEKAQILTDFVLQAAAKMKGVGTEATDTSIRELERYQVAVKQAKEALFEFIKPISVAITGAEIQSWRDFYEWIIRNRVELAKLSEVIVAYIENGFLSIKMVINFVAAHKELIMTILELAVFAKMASYILNIGVALTTVIPQIIAATGAVLGLQIACSGPWAIAIAVTVGGIAYGLNQIRGLQKEIDAAQKKAAAQGHGPLTSPEEGIKLKPVPGISPRGEISPELASQLETDINRDNAGAQARADKAAKKALQDQAVNAPRAAKTGKSAADIEYDQEVRAYLKMVETIRQADLKQAEESIEVLKAEHAVKKAELDKQLAEGLIDGQTYYERLKEMEQGETAAALALIDQKKQAQIKAHADALQGLALEQVSPQVAAYRRYELEMKNRAELAKLDADAAKIRLTGEQRLTEELTKQVEIRRQYREKTEDLTIETAQLLGAISTQEAILQKLYLDWQRAKAEAIKAGGYTPEFAGALQANLQAKQADAQYGAMAGTIVSGFSTLVDSIMQGGQDVLKALNTFFKKLFDDALKSGLDQLKNLLVQGLKAIFGAAGGAIANAVMGVIGLIGMLLTSGGTSSYSASGVQSGVTSHEAVRGLIAGETSIPMAEINVGLKEAMLETNGILQEGFAAVVAAFRGNGGSGSSGTPLIIQAVSRQTLFDWLDQYFADYLQKGLA